MRGSTRTTSAPPATAVAAAFVLSAVAFLAAAAAIPLREQTLVVVVWGLIWLCVVLAVARRLGPLYGVPLAIAVGVAFDSYYIPPTRAFGSDEWQNELVVVIYLGLAVLIGALAERSRRRADASERERGRLAEEQAALRRVATLVARGVEAGEVFSAAAVEVGDLLGGDTARIARFEPDASATIVAESGDHGEPGARWPLEPPLAMEEVFRTGRAARADHYRGAPREIVDRFDRLGGLRASVASPVVVGGRLWGAIVVSSRSGPLPTGTEQRMVEFTELLSIAIANADGRAQLSASRARIVAAADDTRRHVERDLHDGVQQRLVSLALALRTTARHVPAELPELQAGVSQAVDGLNDVTDELREISRGIHPAILSQGGLAPALRTLARRSPLPVTVEVASEERLPQRLEVAAYYVVAEALTNVARHARASAARVDVDADGGALRVRVRDDGVGGADPGRGSGLIGLTDRVEALGGSIAVKSPPGDGTSIQITLPIRLAPG